MFKKYVKNNINEIGYGIVYCQSTDTYKYMHLHTNDK